MAVSIYYSNGSLLCNEYQIACGLLLTDGSWDGLLAGLWWSVHVPEALGCVAYGACDVPMLAANQLDLAVHQLVGLLLVGPLLVGLLLAGRLLGVGACNDCAVFDNT